MPRQRGVELHAAIRREIVEIHAGGEGAEIHVPRRFVDMLVRRRVMGMGIPPHIDHRMRAHELELGEIAHPDREGVAREIDAVQRPLPAYAHAAQSDVLPVAIVAAGGVHLDIAVEERASGDVELSRSVVVVEEPELDVFTSSLSSPRMHADLCAGACHVARHEQVVDVQPGAKARVFRVRRLFGGGQRLHQRHRRDDGRRRQHGKREAVVIGLVLDEAGVEIRHLPSPSTGVLGIVHHILGRMQAHHRPVFRDDGVDFGKRDGCGHGVTRAFLGWLAVGFRGTQHRHRARTPIFGQSGRGSSLGLHWRRGNEHFWRRREHF